MTTYEDYLRESVFKKEEIDFFLNPKESWGQFDPELGYVLGNSMPRTGINGSLTISTAQPNGARTSCIYANHPCRINTYGNSFTECNQVSDHETWQEYLAAHLGEPIRNFGVGGYGVYQAYRRMIRTEQSDQGVEYVILYIWGDDHYRSLLRCRYADIYRWFKCLGGKLLHANFWSNLEIDLQTGKFIEKKNLLATPESLYKMTDPEFMAQALRDDWMLMMNAFIHRYIGDVDRSAINKLAEALNCQPISGGNSEEIRNQVSNIRDAYAFAATKHIIDRAIDFTGKQRKKLMIVLFCPRVTRCLLLTGKRYDEPIVQHLRARNVRYFDMNLVHVEDYKCFKLTPDDYMKRFLIGHYSPVGNHFFAFAIKDAVIQWLDPKPITYRQEQQAQIDFHGYLPNW